MLDGTEKNPRFRAIHKIANSPNPPVTGWDEISMQIFAPCLALQPGNIYGKTAVKNSTRDLADLIENLALFEISHYEAKDVQNFIDFYRMFLSNMEIGPGRPNGIRIRFHHPNETPNVTFARVGNFAMDAIENALQKIKIESQLAEDLHATHADLHPYPNHPPSKSRIRIEGDLKQAVDDLRRLSRGEQVRPGSYRGGTISSSPGLAGSRQETGLTDLSPREMLI